MKNTGESAEARRAFSSYIMGHDGMQDSTPRLRKVGLFMHIKKGRKNSAPFYRKPRTMLLKQ